MLGGLLNLLDQPLLIALQGSDFSLNICAPRSSSFNVVKRAEDVNTKCVWVCKCHGEAGTLYKHASSFVALSKEKCVCVYSFASSCLLQDMGMLTIPPSSSLNSMRML